MRLLKLLIPALAMAQLLGACKKKDESPAPTPIDTAVIVYPDYGALKPGNYWVYREYMLDSVDGAANPQSEIDSAYVEKDTTINGHTYHKYCIKTTGPSSTEVRYLRDSLSYIVDKTGRIRMSSFNFTDTFVIRYSYPSAAHPDTIRVTDQMGFKNLSVTVEAGTFKTNTFREIWHMPPSLAYYGPTRENDCMYSLGVGIVKETIGFYINSPQIFERRLLRYHLN